MIAIGQSGCSIFSVFFFFLFSAAYKYCPPSVCQTNALTNPERLTNYNIYCKIATLCKNEVHEAEVYNSIINYIKQAIKLKTLKHTCFAVSFFYLFFFSNFSPKPKLYQLVPVALSRGYRLNIFHLGPGALTFTCINVK